MGKFKFMETSIEGVYIVEPTVFGDERGYFMCLFNLSFLSSNSFTKPVFLI